LIKLDTEQIIQQDRHPIWRQDAAAAASLTILPVR